MNDFERRLPVLPEDVSMQIERLRVGGIVLGELSAPEKSMDNFVRSHLASVALLSAQGDQRPERPYYIYNPASGTLINYALRRDSHPDRAGLFADIVELDVNGKPRHGLSVANPFEARAGFVHVKVGENDHGFAPAEVRFRLEDDLESIVPPTIEAADLVSMINADPIPEGMSLAEFQATRSSDRDDMRRRVQERQYTNFRGTKQAIGTQTDPDYHMIITDRDDTSAFEAASREVGVFPIIIPAKAIVEAYHEMKTIGVPDPEQTFSRFSNYVHFSEGPQGYIDLLRTTVPAFFTYDFEQICGEYSEVNQAVKCVSFPKPRGNPVDVRHAVHSILLEGRVGADGIVDSTPFFSKMFNNRIPVYADDLDPVTKKQHGVYELPIDTSNAACMEIYTGWLRKVRADYALTLYLRDLSKL